MTVVEVGCVMGFFSIPMAGMVGPKGRVVGVEKFSMFYFPPAGRQVGKDRGHMGQIVAMADVTRAQGVGLVQCVRILAGQDDDDGDAVEKIFDRYQRFKGFLVVNYQIRAAGATLGW